MKRLAIFLLLNLQQIDAVLSASLSVFRSARLKKIFEVWPITTLTLHPLNFNFFLKQIILAFGNYMNSSRRGAVYGFRLESLGKVHQ